MKKELDFSHPEKIKVAVIGLGYVGLPLALMLDERGYHVVGIDVDDKKIAQINQKVAPFADKEMAKKLKTGNISATNDYAAMNDAAIAVICVPTPVDHFKQPDLGPVKSVAENIAKHLTKGQLIILESTVNPGVSEQIVVPILEKTSGLKAGIDFDFSHCPERVNPGDKIWTVDKIPRVVGSLTKTGLNASAAFYRSFLGGSVKLMKSVKEAEAVKIVENTFRDINIAFVNELAMSFSRLGIDLVNVLDGAATKPFAFMAHAPGVGVGGHCIPVDPYYLISYAEENGFHHQLLSLARRINEKMPKFTAELAIKSLQEAKIPVQGAKVAVLGLAYKPDVDDDRESPSFKLIESLRSFGLNVVSYDPFIPGKSSAGSISDAVSGASAIVIATAHTEFKNMEPDDLKRGGARIVVDGRNCLSKEKYEAQGFRYVGIGR